MKDSQNSASQPISQQRIELELLHSVLDDDTASYPWNPCDPAAAEYVDRLESEFATGELSDDVFNSQWQQVSQAAQQLWANSSESLLTTLSREFGARMPQNLLSQIAATAQTAAKSSQPLIDQLVASAQAVLTGWESDDLQVMARPLALAMRSGGQSEILDATLNSVRTVEWDTLSAMEQARLTLAISRYALAELAVDE